MGIPVARVRVRRYTSLRDLLRVVRNKRTHFYEMPPETQKQMGPFPGGFLRCVPPPPPFPPHHSPLSNASFTSHVRASSSSGLYCIQQLDCQDTLHCFWISRHLPAFAG